jgi:AcrR family transcriptional regulator
LPPVASLSTTPSTRPLRADAARNRAKVLDAAREAFADEGRDADIASIARRAGVGVGTVYRHFPTKEALIEALVEDHFDRLAVVGLECERTLSDPWEAFEQMILRTARLTAEDHGMCEVLAEQSPSAVEAATREKCDLHGMATRLVEAAKASGQMRSDATGDDVPTIMCGFGKVAAAQRAGRPVDWQRFLRLALDGLRAR